MADRRRTHWNGNESSVIALPQNAMTDQTILGPADLVKGETITRTIVDMAIRLSISGNVRQAFGWGIHVTDESAVIGGMPDPLVEYDGDWLIHGAGWLQPFEVCFERRYFELDVHSQRVIRSDNKKLVMVMKTGPNALALDFGWAVRCLLLNA